HQVSGPNEVITSAVVIALGLSPGDAQGGDQRALKNLVFMGQQHATAKPVHSAAIGGIIAEVELGIHDRALPLADITRAVRFKRLGQRLEQFGGGALVAATTRNGDCEFTAAGEIDFSSQRDVASLGGAELPVHFEIAHQILPAIAGPNVTDGPASKFGAAGNNQVNVFALRVDQFAGADFRTPGGVAGTVGCHQRVKAQLPAQ